MRTVLVLLSMMVLAGCVDSSKEDVIADWVIQRTDYQRDTAMSVCMRVSEQNPNPNVDECRAFAEDYFPTRTREYVKSVLNTSKIEVYVGTIPNGKH